MRLQKLVIGLIPMILLIITGCSNEIGDEEQRIEVQKRIGDENKYEDFREVTNDEEVRQVKEIINKTDWINTVVNMIGPPDYEFIFQYKNPEIEAKAVLYQLWISPNKDQIEIVQGDSQYAQLSKDQSAVLYKIITGDILADLK